MRHKIETKRLTLRPFEPKDLKALVTYAGDIDVSRATGQLPHPYTKAEARSWLDFNQTNASANNHIYAVASQDNQLLGCVSLMPKNDTWELGYWLGQPHWHKGYMREALFSFTCRSQTKPRTDKALRLCLHRQPQKPSLVAASWFQTMRTKHRVLRLQRP